MTWIDRLLGRRPQNNYHLTVNSVPKEPPKPHNFCSHCGQPMVDGYMVIGRAFDTESGNPVLQILRRRLCLSLNKQEKPPRRKDGEPENPMEEHDGFPLYTIVDSWLAGMGTRQYETIPDCERAA